VRPFPSVTAALRFHRRQAQNLAEAHSLSPRERIQDRDWRGRREDLLSVWLSVGICLKVLSSQEIGALREALDNPERRLARGTAGLYHRAMTRLGKEMRRRGVVV